MATNNAWNNQVNAAFNQIILNSGTNGVAISTDASAATVDIATGAGAKVVTLGSTNGASSLALKYGTADMTLASATGTIMSALDTGEITYPLQSAFFAILGSTDSNVTGDGTAYVIGTNVALTEIFDQNSDFNTNGTFTAPVTGRYHFSGNVSLADVTASTFNIRFRIVASNRRYDFYLVTSAISASLQELAGSGFIDMDAADICQLVIIADSGTKIIDLNGDATQAVTSFSGYLAC